jgi:hypothetical protein
MKTLSLILTIVLLQLIAQAKDKPSKLVEHRDVPLQTVYVYAKPIKQCAYGLLFNKGYCVEVRTVAQQSFKKDTKELIMHFEFSSNDGAWLYTYTKIAFNIDGEMSLA